MRSMLSVVERIERCDGQINQIPRLWNNVEAWQPNTGREIMSDLFTKFVDVAYTKSPFGIVTCCLWFCLTVAFSCVAAQGVGARHGHEFEFCFIVQARFRSTSNRIILIKGNRLGDSDTVDDGHHVRRERHSFWTFGDSPAMAPNWLLDKPLSLDFPAHCCLSGFFIWRAQLSLHRAGFESCLRLYLVL